jgi:hypothetical protein
MAKKNYNKDIQYLMYITFAVLVILLSIFNLQNVSQNKNEVLGAATVISKIELENEKFFWEEFQKINPTYIDGWIELGRLDKVKEIDPNYFTY